jgi:hypothetical protein
MISVHSSPFVRLNVRASDSAPVHIGLFLLDTGTTATVIDRDFARDVGFSNFEKCPVYGQLQLGKNYLNSSFGINNTDRRQCSASAADRRFDEFKPDRAGTAVKQNGIVGVDWLDSTVTRLDFDRQVVSTWNGTGWRKCIGVFADHQSIPVADASVSSIDDGRIVNSVCSFRRKGTGCNNPYVVGTIGGSTQRPLPIVMLVDTGRDASWTLLSVNDALLDVLLQNGLVIRSNCAGGAPGTRCNRGIYALKPGLKLEIAGITWPLDSVEFRDSSNGRFYRRSAPFGLVGMRMFSSYHSVILDPFGGQLLLK